jgi:hypothetical protein
MSLYRLERMLPTIPRREKLPVITQPPFSPDLTLSDVLLFTTQKMGPKTSCHHPTTFLSRSHSEWLSVVHYSENVPQGDTLHNQVGRQIECNSLTLENSKRSLQPVLSAMVGSMEQMCVCARVLLWRWLGTFWLPTVFLCMRHEIQKRIQFWAMIIRHKPCMKSCS